MLSRRAHCLCFAIYDLATAIGVMIWIVILVQAGEAIPGPLVSAVGVYSVIRLFLSVVLIIGVERKNCILLTIWLYLTGIEGLFEAAFVIFVLVLNFGPEKIYDPIRHGEMGVGLRVTALVMNVVGLLDTIIQVASMLVVRLCCTEYLEERERRQRADEHLYKALRRGNSVALSGS